MNLRAAVNPAVPAQTTVERTVKVGVVTSLSVIGLLLLQAVASTIIQNPQYFSWKSGILVTIANMVIVFIPNLMNKNVPNS